ncbi:MAG: alanine--tRNA ligase [Bdellovibrionota bacterium]
MTAAQIRAEFLKFFEKNGHTIVESSSLVPQNDPTLLFTNAGMVQFKDVFLGTDPRPYRRATTSQKCVRAGGKHNDLENVGFTARHHTFFEMLGNFSFGDYFKKDAIRFAWEFITQNLGIDKKLLYVTVYKDDDEAAEIWEKQENIPKERIYRFGEKDNFWAMGDTGPCGPCSEIFVDRGEKYGCGKSSCAVGCDCDRFMEIWNLVFMQFERSKDGKLTPLPKPSIDTGMGLERVASVVQNVATNYDTDLFQDLITSIGDLAKVKYGKSEKIDVSLRVVADHCRATNFLIADGVLPSNEGRGYVLRRIMRRAIRHGRNLGFREPFFFKLTQSLIRLMGDAYPELKDKREYLESTIKLEEERFLTTLDNGMRILEDEMAKAKNKTLSGEVAFKLYDTYGFPLDLTQVIARENQLSVDEPAFQRAMEAQRERSRENWKGSGEEAVGEVYKQLQQKGLKSTFRGYDALGCDGKVLAIVEEGKPVEKTSTADFQLIVDQTPFYAESGGQIGDQGEITTASGVKAKVADVKKPTGDFIVIHCTEAQGQLKVGELIQQNTNRALRALTAKNHTATHMLHHALRKFLGPHVKQAGSLVSAELLRFDFTHPKPLTEEEIERIEDFINESISQAEAVQSEETDKEKALAKGAIAFFGDKYGSRVRVISVGDYSVELCGGTHVRNTADIQMFKIVNENGIASGVRRIIAVTGPAVLGLLREKEKHLKNIMRTLRASAPAEVPAKIEKLQATERELRKALESQSRKSASNELDRWIAEAINVNGAKLIRAVVQLNDGENAAKSLRDLADLIRSKVQKSVVALAAKDSAKNQSVLLVAVTKDLSEKYKANEIIKQVAPILEGSGGGKPDLAQAGGKNENFNEAFTAIQNLLIP